MLFQKEIVRLLFSERYLESAPAFPLLMANLGLMNIGNILGATLVAVNQADKPVKINIVATITNVFGNLIMIPLYGVMGAVYATIISSCATNPFIIWFLKKANVKVEATQYIKPILAFGVCSVMFFIFKPESMMAKLFLIVLFLCICFILSVVRRNDFLILFKNK